MGFADSLISGAAGGATVAIVIRAYDQFSGTFDKAGAGVSRLSTVLKVGGIALAAVASGMVAFGVSSVKAAAQAENIIVQFKRMAQNSDELIESLKRATKGTVDDTALMQSSIRALAMGMNQAKIPEMFEKAAIMGQTMGLDTLDAINRLTEGIAKQRTVTLSELGIIMDATEANKKYAASHKITVEQMTEAQKATAFYNEAMLQLNNNIQKNGLQFNMGFSQSLQQIKADYENLKEEVGFKLLPQMKELTKAIVDNKEAWITMGQVAGDVLAKIVNGVGWYVAKVSDLGTKLSHLVHGEPRSPAIGSPEDIARIQALYKEQESALVASRGPGGFIGLGREGSEQLLKAKEEEAAASNTLTAEVINLSGNFQAQKEKVAEMTALYREAYMVQADDMKSKIAMINKQVQYEYSMKNLDEVTKRLVQTYVEAMTKINRFADKRKGTGESLRGRSNVVWDSASETYVSQSNYAENRGYNPALHTGNVTNNYYTADHSAQVNRVTGVA